MADGDNLVIGQNNAGASRTLLERTSNNPDTAFQVANNLGVGIGVFTQRGNAISASSLAGPFAGIFASSMEETGILGYTENQAFVTPPQFRRAGVLGTAINHAGVLGESSEGVGVRGEAPRNRGVYGISSIAAGVSGQSTDWKGVEATSERNDGVWGLTLGVSNTRAGVWGEAADTETGVIGQSVNSTGVLGRSFGTERSGPGVYGIGPRNTYWAGVYGVPGDPAGQGVRGESTSGQGVAGVAGVNGWGGDFVGPATGISNTGGGLRVTGNFLQRGGFKSTAVPHPDGSHRVLYCLESPESWFEDFGRAEVTKGRARVDLDPDFAALVETEGYHVFLTPEGDSNGLYVTHREQGGFEVSEQQDGEGNLTFSYRVVAKRKDIAPERLASIEMPEGRPELTELLDREQLPKPPEPTQDSKFTAVVPSSTGREGIDGPQEQLQSEGQQEERQIAELRRQMEELQHQMEELRRQL